MAAAAGVSRRTVYRYLTIKDDLIFEAPRQWLEVLNSVLDTRTENEATRDVYARAILDVARDIEDNSTTVLASFNVLIASPSLFARHAEWTARYMEPLIPDVANEPDGALIATTAAMTLVAAQNALVAVWAAAQPDSDLIAMTLTLLDRLDSIWPAASR